MSQYAVVFLLSKPPAPLHKFRREFDPESRFIPPYITVVFPMPAHRERELIADLDRKLQGFTPFNVHLEGIRLNPKNNALELMVTSGQETIKQLHNELYSGLLEKYLRKDLPYEPVLTLGNMSDENDGLDQDCYDEALERLAENPLTLDLLFDNVNIIKIDDAEQPITLIHTFLIG